MVAISTTATARISLSDGGVQGNGDSVFSDLSADGRYVVFESVAGNLVPGGTNGEQDIFLRDTATGHTILISGADGAQANDASTLPAISDDGRFVAFESSASNLVAGDTNGQIDVFLRDTLTGSTTLLSTATDGTQGNAGSGDPDISGDGRFVCFDSTATNLVAGDSNGVEDIFLRDTLTGTTTRLSVATDGTQANGDSFGSHISGDGRFVAFGSNATNLVAGDTNGASDIFLRDTVAGTTSLVSVATGGAQANDASNIDGISADGRYVVFQSFATNLVAGDTNGASDIFLRDTVAGTTIRLSVGLGGAQANGASFLPEISADGHYVTFSSGASNLVAGDTNGVNDIFRVSLVASNAADWMVGSDGSDTLSGLGGSDILTAGLGNDRLIGGAGIDTLDGGLGNDTYVIAAGDTDANGTILDHITDAGGTDAVEASVTVSIATLPAIENVVLTGTGNIDATGNAAANALTGNAGANHLSGGAGLDTLNGGAGNDVLTGGAGKDNLTGGAGADTFVYTTIGDSPVGGSTTSDAITDFSHAQGDRIDLSAIDANTGVAGDQAFSFIGAAAFTHHAGELRAVSAGGVTSVYGDVNGDGTADFQIRLSGTITLVAGDFVL